MWGKNQIFCESYFGGVLANEGVVFWIPIALMLGIATVGSITEITASFLLDFGESMQLMVFGN